MLMRNNRNHDFNLAANFFTTDKQYDAYYYIRKLVIDQINFLRKLCLKILIKQSFEKIIRK